MTRFVFLWAGLCCTTVLAQPVPAAVDAPPETVARERSRIEAERRREDARFAGEEAACYQRFAVNDCLREVRVRRRAAFEDLRRQEIELNDAQRRSRAAEQLRRIEDKMSPRAQQEDADRRGAAQQERQDRNDRAAAKRAERAQADAERSGRPPRQATTGSGPSEAAQAENRRQFEEKQRQAQERRAQRDKAQAEKAGQPPAQPLPQTP